MYCGHALGVKQFSMVTQPKQKGNGSFHIDFITFVTFAHIQEPGETPWLKVQIHVFIPKAIENATYKMRNVSHMGTHNVQSSIGIVICNQITHLNGTNLSF